MKTSRAKKGFDCVESKRQAQARIYEKIKDFSPEQEIEYFRKAVEEGALVSLRQFAQRRPVALGKPS